MLRLVGLLAQGTVGAADDQPGYGIGRGLFVNDLAGDLGSVFVNDLGGIVHHAVYAVNEHQLGVRLQLGVFEVIGLIGDNLVVFLGDGLAIDDLKHHTVVRGAVGLAGQDVAVVQLDARALKQRADGLAVGADDAFLAAVDDGYHLHPLDVDAADAVIVCGSIGILLAQLNAYFVEYDVGVCAVGLMNGHEITVGDDVAVLCENRQCQNGRQGSDHCSDRQQATGQMTKQSSSFLSVHQSNSSFPLWLVSRGKTIVTLL